MAGARPAGRKPHRRLITRIQLIKSEIPSGAIDLPPPNTKRWVTRRKAVVVNAVRSGGFRGCSEVTNRSCINRLVASTRAYLEEHGKPVAFYPRGLLHPHRPA